MDARKLALALGSFALAAGVAWWLVGARLRSGSGGTTRIADNGAEARALLLARARSGAPPAAGKGVMPEQIPEQEARAMFGSFAVAEVIYDPHSHYRYRAGIDIKVHVAELPGKAYRMITNSWGMRELEDPEDGAGSPCLIGTGDSHTDGVCDAEQSWPNLIEAALRRQPGGAGACVWNSGFGGYSFYEYLGTLRRCRELQPKLFVVCSYAGNDYLDVIRPWAYFERRAPPQVPEEPTKAVLRESLRSPQAVSQCLQQAVYFRELPQLAEVAVRTAARVSRELAAEAAADGCVALFVHLPCAADVQRARYDDVLGPACERLGLSDEHLGVSLRLGDGWIGMLRASGLPVLDLRPAFRAASEELYWPSDHHINLRGQELVAEAVLQWLAEQPRDSVLAGIELAR